MPGPRSAKRFPRRLGLAADLASMAWFPSYRAPHPCELLDPDPFTPPGPPPMTAAGRRLLDAVLAGPDADAPRLAYADWLDAQGDPRGEFVRVQIELQTRPTPALRLREHDLLLAHRSGWVELFGPWSAEDIVFRRGFAEAMSLSGRAFISISEGLFRTTPLRDVRLVAIAPYLQELAASPRLARLARLDLGGNRLGPEGVRLLAASPHLVGLQELDLSRNALASEGSAVLAAGWPSPLKALSVADNGLTGADISLLLAASQCRAVTDLDLSHNPLGPGLGELLASTGFPDRAIRLALGFTGLAPADLRELARSGAQPCKLDLRFNGLGDDVLEDLAGSELSSKCTALNLRGNRLTRANGLRSGPVSRLDVSVNPLGNAGVLDLIGAGWPGLIELRLVNVGLTAAGVEHLVSSGGLAGLERFDLGGNSLGDAGVEVLAACPDLADLRELDLTAVDLGFAGAVALARSEMLTSLRSLAVGLNPRLPADGVSLLRERFSTVID